MLLTTHTNAKTKLSLSTPRKHTRGAEVQVHSFLTLALEGDEWSTSCPGHVTSGKEPNQLGGAGWAAGPGPSFGEEKIFWPLPRIEPRTL